MGKHCTTAAWQREMLCVTNPCKLYKDMVRMYCGSTCDVELNSHANMRLDSGARRSRLNVNKAVSVFSALACKLMCAVPEHKKTPLRLVDILLYKVFLCGPGIRCKILQFQHIMKSHHDDVLFLISNHDLKIS